MALQSPKLPDHEASSVDEVAAFHRDHYRSSSPLQRAIDGFNARLGRPVVVISIILGFGLWSAVAALIGRGQIDQPSFAWLELAGTLASLLVSLLILVTQRRYDELAERRAQLTLDVALLADKKIAKTIALLEELRRDAPAVADRVDAESEEMSKPADTKTVLAAIDARSSAR